MCEHKRLVYFKQHYRCRDCQEWWPYPHLLAARHPDKKVVWKLETKLTDAEVVHEAMDRFTFAPVGLIIGGVVRTALLSSGMKVSDEEIGRTVEKAFREWQADKSLSKYRKPPEQKKESS